MGLPSLNALACLDKLVTIYALIDPRDQTPFYVGATTARPCERLGSHVTDARHHRLRSGKCDLIRGILAYGARPEMMALEVVAQSGWVEAEQFWIANLRFLGAKLTNKSMGGAGNQGVKPSPETLARMSEAAIHRDMAAVHTADARERAAGKLRHPIEIDGSVYSGIAVASRATGIPQSTLIYRLDVGAGPLRIRPRKDAAGGRKRIGGGPPSAERHHNSLPIEIDGVRYWGRTGACLALGVSQTKLRNWILSGRAKYVSGKTLPPKKRPPLKGRRTGSAHHSSMAVLIDGSRYVSLTAAAVALGRDRDSIRRWIKSGRAQICN